MAAKSPRGNELAELEQDIFRARTSSNALKSLLSECKQDEETSRSVSRSTSHLGSRATSRATSPRLSSREPTLSSDELAPEIRVVRNPVAVRSAAPRPPSSTASASENGTSNGHSPPTTPLNGGVARWSDSQPAPGSVDMPPAQQAERATGAIDVTTIKSLKDTIESLLRDLNKAINERDTAMQEIARLAAQLAAAQADDHGEFLRMEVKSLRENKKHLEDALHTAVQDHKKELQELRQRFVDEMERSSQDKSVAIEDIEQSYSEALRAAQARTSEAREETRKANERSEQLTRDLEAVRAQLRQVESDRAFQVSSLEDERRQFNRFREDALKKHADLTDKNLENERHISQTETKLRAAQMELGAQKQEHERAADKMRQEMETLMQSRDTARSNASTLRRELDSSNEDILEWKRAAAKLEKELRDVLEAKKSSDAAAAAFQDKLAVVERARAQELEDLAQIKAALVAHQREHAATQERAKSRLQKVRDAIQPDTLFVQFNRPPSLEHTNARGGDDVAEGVANAQAPTAADQRKDAGVARELARRGEEEEEEEEAPVVLQRKEQSRATRAAAPPQRRSELPPPAATAEAGGGRPRSPSAPLAGKPPISPPSAGLGNLSLLGPSPPPAPETGAGWFPHQRTTPEASLDARKAVLLPRAGTAEQGEIEDVFLEAPVRALADIYVVSARDAPMEHQHRQMHVHTRVGWQAVVTRGVGAGEGTERGSRAWHSNFRCASSDPQNDIVIFDVEVLLGEGEERKQGAPVAVMPDGQRWEQVGRVAVPLSRVLVTGKEAGWYEVRSLMGAPIFTSPGVPFRLQIGCAAAAVSTDIQRKPLKAGVLYCMSERGAWEHRHALLDPYSQLLFLSEERLLLPEIMVEGSPSCVSVRTGTASFDAKEPRRFVVHNEEGQSVSFCGITADSASDWLDCLEISGCHIAEETRQTNHESRSRPPSRPSSGFIAGDGPLSQPEPLSVDSPLFRQEDKSPALGPSAIEAVLQKRPPNVTRAAPPQAEGLQTASIAVTDFKKPASIAVTDLKEQIVLCIKGARDLPPQESGGLTALRNPVVLISVKSGRFCSKVVELSLNPVFNQYAIIRLREDPVVLVEVFDDDQSGEGMCNGAGTLLLGSVMLSGDVLCALPGGREKSLWLPLSTVGLPPTDKPPQLLISVTALGDNRQPLPSNGKPLEAVAVAPTSYIPSAPSSFVTPSPASLRTGTPPAVPSGSLPPVSPPSAPASRELGANSQLWMHDLSRSPSTLDDWESKSAAVKEQLREAAKWFEDEDVVSLMEGARNSRGSSQTQARGSGMDGGGWEEGEGEMHIPADLEGKSGLVVVGALHGGAGNGEPEECICLSVLHAGAVAVGLRDGGVLVYPSWQPSASKDCRRLKGHEAPVMAIAAVGERGLISGCEQGRIFLWDLPSQEALFSIKAHAGAVLALARAQLMPARDTSGCMLVGSASQDGNVKMWQVQHKADAAGKHAARQPKTQSESVECVAVLRKHQGGVLCLASCQPYLLSGGEDKSICVWSPKDDWQCAELLEGHAAPVVAITTLPELEDGRVQDRRRADTVAPFQCFASISRDGTAIIWETFTWSVMREISSSGLPSAIQSMHLYGSFLYSADEFGIFSWETPSWSPSGRLTLHKTTTRDRVAHMAVVPATSRPQPGGGRIDMSAAVLVLNRSGEILVCSCGNPGAAVSDSKQNVGDIIIM